MADVSPRPIRRLLIANRGEIARRILRTAHRIDLVHAQQVTRREDHRMRPPPLITLRRTDHDEGGHPGNLRRNDVHHDAARVHGPSTRHVEAHP